MRLATIIFVGLTGIASAAPYIGLSPEEQAWIDAHPVIRVGSDPMWPPFSIVNKQGHVEGIDVDILRDLGRKLGLTFNFEPSADWEQAWQRFTRNELDLTVGTALTSKRVAAADFSVAYISIPVAIITRNDAPFLVGLRALSGKTLALPAGHVTTERVLEDYPEITSLLAESSSAAMLMVSKGKADATIENLATASHIIRTHGLSNLKIAGLADYHFELRYAIRKDMPELTALLNRALAWQPEDTRNQILDRWIPVNYEDAINWQSVWRGVRWVAIFSVIVIVIAFVWSRSLSKELRARLRAEEALRQRDDEISEANSALRALNDEKDMLMHMAAHDLNGAVTTVILAASALEAESEPLNAHATEHLSYINESSDRMTRLIRNLLQIDLIEARRGQLTLSSVDISNVLARVTKRNRRLAKEKNISVELAQRAHTAPVISGNDDALDQVLDNLVSNAIKYSPRGKHVSINLATHEGNWRVEVRDQGPGVRPEDMSKLFKKFSKLGAIPTGGETSTGLGLAIVKRLVEAMNGRVWCESNGGNGAAFIVEFPIIGKIS